MNAATAKPEIRSSARIPTLEGLLEHLQWAIELEHFTLPPYLCALYSLDAVHNPEASEVVASVLVEEMLHMTLAANVRLLDEQLGICEIRVSLSRPLRTAIVEAPRLTWNARCAADISTIELHLAQHMALWRAGRT
jgi:Ferritin-like